MLRDPRMSEWGNPAVAIPSLLLGGVERTWGTETSQYPQEEKITMIAPVVASERARAQTAGVKAPRGVVGPSTVWTQDDSGTRWKARPERVTAPYAKCRWSQRDPEYTETRGTLVERAGTTP